MPRLRSDDGFTLIELLVVILIVGILAAIALPTFLGQQKKGQDSSAKAMARNLVTQIESCLTETQDYSGCMDADLQAMQLTGSADFGTAAGQVTVVSATESTFVVEAVSKAKSGNANHRFRISRVASADVQRSCTPTGQGGCPSSGSW